MAGLVARLLDRGRDRLAPLPDEDAPYWEARARRYGSRSVLHLGHPPDREAAVADLQIRHLFPHLRGALDGSEAVILDFGCGSGRFTPALAALIRGRAIGVDPTRALLEMAPAAPGVEYRRMTGGRVPLEDAGVDVVWSAIVLGCITTDAALRLAAEEILRVLRPGGLLFLAENTTDKRSGPHFVFRPAEAYRDLFPSVFLSEVGSYRDLGETITVLAGRRAGRERAAG
jgi:SAM-dependent methyltransferase